MIWGDDALVSGYYNNPPTTDPVIVLNNLWISIFIIIIINYTCNLSSMTLIQSTGTVAEHTPLCVMKMSDNKMRQDGT